MRHAFVIENIEELRTENGIEDTELRQAIRTLCVGDIVRLTLLKDPAPSGGEVVEVRITRIEGRNYRGKLVAGPTSPGLADIPSGMSIAFTWHQIHSLAKGLPNHDD